MMRFPPRLKWDLARVRIAQKLFASSRRPLVLHLDLSDFPTQSESRAFSAGEVPTDANAEPASSLSSRDARVLAQVRENAEPIVWIGGDTPLHYPRIGHLAREIVNLGRTVFLETNGTLLRRRIHEFRPVARLYLVLPLNGPEPAHDSRAQQPGNFRATVESIRTAKLSGFHICVETTIFSDTQSTELRELAEFIQKLDIDGWIQTRPPVSTTDQPAEEKLAAARELIPNRGWKKFSEHLCLRRRLPHGEKLLLGAPHAEFACGEVGNLRSSPQPNLPTQPKQELPTTKESAHAL